MTSGRPGAPHATRWLLIGFLVCGFLAGQGTAAGKPGKTDQVAVLVDRIADVDQTLTDLEDEVATKQENVNRTLVDFQNARAAQQVAVAADRGARQSLTGAISRVAQAQKRFDALVRAMSRHGARLGGMTDYLTADEPAAVLDRLAAADRVTHDQQRIIRRLQVSRNQRANRVAATEATRAQTAAAAVEAGDRKNAAITAVDEVRAAVHAQQAERKALVAQRTSIAAELAALRDRASGDRGRHPVADDDVENPAAPEAGQDPLAQAAQAAAALALDTGQKFLADLVGRQQLPRSDLLDELGLGSGGAEPPGSRSNGSLPALFTRGDRDGGTGPVQPGLRGPAAVETVVDRMTSQLGVTYAWGGGDASGPTLGVLDGGVADSYGDFQKVGFDCSGLMVYGFAGVGIDLPHYTGYQYTSGPQVPLAEMQRGDIIFYGPEASTHNALILGDGTMIEAPQSGDVVKISPVRTAGAMPNVVRLL